MQLIHDGGRFVAISSYEERMVPKEAGFRWDPAIKKWWTDKSERAARLAQYADDSAKAALSTHVAAVEASKASAIPTGFEGAIPAPAGRTYLPYQEAGIRYALNRKGCLIADEPGLGKTIQAIGIVNASPEIKKVLVICPASLRLNWAREAGKWLTREFRTTVITNGESLNLDGPEAQLVIVNYDRLSKRPELAATSWDLLVIDEAHYAKNPKAARSKLVYKLAANSTRTVGLTGTPILNRPIELHPILAMIDKATWGDGVLCDACNAAKAEAARVAQAQKRPAGRFNSCETCKVNSSKFWNFLRRYCDAHKEHVPGKGMLWNLTGSSNLSELQEKLRASCMVRRLKADVLTELPAKRRSYIPMLVKGYLDDNDAGKVLAKLQTLAELKELARDMGDEESYAGYEEEEEKTAGFAFTEMSAYRRKLGISKVETGIEYVSDLLESGVNKVVVFAHHKDVLEALQKGLAEFGAVRCDGSVSLDERQAAVDAFQTQPGVRVFVASTLAMGVGWTLTAASNVVFVESDWVPANLVQAEDRCHRIGQRDVVQTHILTVPGTLDEYMLQMVEDKAAIAASALDKDTSITVPESIVQAVKARPPVESKYTVDPVLRQTLLVALRSIAGECDGAVTEDEKGFNRLDTGFGKKLAKLSDLTDKQYNVAYKMARKYRGQVPDEVCEVLGFYTKKEAA